MFQITFEDEIKHSAGPKLFCIFQESTTVFNSLKGEKFDVHLYPELPIRQKSIALWKVPRLPLVTASCRWRWVRNIGGMILTGENRSTGRNTCHSYHLFFFVALRPNVGHGLLILEVSRSHTMTHHSRYHSSGRVISSSQRPLPDNTQYSQQTNIYSPGGIRTHDLSRRAAAGLHLRPRGHWDRHIYIYIHTHTDEIMWKNNVEPDGPQMRIWRMRIACWTPVYSHTHTHRACRTYCFPTTNAPQYYIIVTLPISS